MDFVDQVTLDCLANRGNGTSRKYVHTSLAEERRSLALFQALLGGIRVENLPPGVEYAFKNFMASASDYFHQQDELEQMALYYEEESNDAVALDMASWRVMKERTTSDADIKRVTLAPQSLGREQSKDWKEKYVGIDYAKDTLDEETQEDQTASHAGWNAFKENAI